MTSGEGGSLSHTHSTIPALGIGIFDNNGSITALKILLSRRLNVHLVLGLEANSGLIFGSLGGAAASAVESRSRHDG